MKADPTFSVPCHVSEHADKGIDPVGASVDDDGFC